MQHRKVQMAVIVQPFISDKSTHLDVLMNGVCITHDVSRHKIKHGFVVNTYFVLTNRSVYVLRV